MGSLIGRERDVGMMMGGLGVRVRKCDEPRTGLCGVRRFQNASVNGL
jgi:hypothetical protein